jgi:hypothetical protein
MDKSHCIQSGRAKMATLLKVQYVLFGFRANLALHLERSPLSHSFGYDSAADRPSCFASYTLIPESFTQYAG